MTPNRNSNAVTRRGRPTALMTLGDVEKANRQMLQKVDECNRRMDCTDFRLNALLRGMVLFADEVRPEVKQAIKDAALSARYYGGNSRDYPMFYSSENHHMNWAVAEYLAGQLWPDEVFRFDGRTSRQHRDRARYVIANWIDTRSRFGYCEWNSCCYMGVTLLGLLNLVDLADEPVIRRLAADATTQLLADLAADSLAGGVWGAQARIYQKQLFDKNAQNVAPALSILLGASDPAELGACEAGGDAAGEFARVRALLSQALLDGPGQRGQVQRRPVPGFCGDLVQLHSGDGGEVKPAPQLLHRRPRRVVIPGRYA
jgi:hypothetical protein